MQVKECNLPDDHNGFAYHRRILEGEGNATNSNIGKHFEPVISLDKEDFKRVDTKVDVIDSCVSFVRADREPSVNYKPVLYKSDSLLSESKRTDLAASSNCEQHFNNTQSCVTVKAVEEAMDKDFHPEKMLNDENFQMESNYIEKRNKDCRVVNLRVMSVLQCLGRCYACELCNDFFSSKNSLRLHINNHLKSSLPLSCSTCGKHFSSLRMLKGHELTHGDMKPFICEKRFCGKSFLLR